MVKEQKSRLIDAKDIFLKQVSLLMQSVITLSGCENIYYFAWRRDKNNYGLEAWEIQGKTKVSNTVVLKKPLLDSIKYLKSPTVPVKAELQDIIEGFYSPESKGSSPGSVALYSINNSNGHLGLLLLDHQQPGSLHPNSQPALQNLIDLLSAQVESYNYLSRYRDRCELYSIMLEVNTHLNVAASKKDFLTEIGRIAKYFLKCNRAVIALKQDTFKPYFTIDAIDGERKGIEVGDTYPVEKTLVGRAIEKGKIQLYKPEAPPPISGIYDQDDLKDYFFNSAVAFPLVESENGPGALILEFDEAQEIVEMDIKLFGMIGLNLGAALNRLNLYEAMKMNATTDALTKLYNSRTLKERLTEELTRAKRYQSALTLLFLDLDKFKRVNDTYGHLMGDFVLHETAQIIKDNVRTIDIVGRYGGEEFVVILINAVAEDILKTAERICERIASHRFEMDGQKLSIRISIGVASFPTDGNSETELLHASDAAMYATKGKGGNGVTIYQPGMQPKYHSF